MRLAAFPLIALAVIAPPSGQQRDARVVPTFGTAVISGVVVDDATPPRPVRRAIVTASGDELKPSRSVVTDDSGRFAIDRLPAGHFALTVTRSSYVTSSYGAVRPGRPGSILAVAAGQRLENLTVRLWRGAAVAGVLRDESGVPVASVPVSVLPLRATTDSTMLTLSNNGVATNDVGEFRIFGLPPGSYLVMAKPAASGGPPLVGMTDAQVDAALAAIATRSTTSSRAATQPKAATVADQPSTFAWAPVFFPGTAEITQAAVVTLGPGQERTGLDFALRRVPTSVVSGVLTRPDGQRAPGIAVRLQVKPPAGPLPVESPLVFSASSGADGTFSLSQVTPGDYQLLAISPASSVQPAALFATADVFVGGGDVSGLALMLERCVTMTGVVRFDGSTVRPPIDLSKLRVGVLTPAQFAARPGPVSAGFVFPVPIAADGTFRIAGIMPGTYMLIVRGPGLDSAGWLPRSAIAGDRDLLDGTFEITRGSDLSNVVITLSDRHTEVSGKLTTTSGALPADVFVIVFGADRRDWSTNSRRVQAVHPGSDAAFVLKDLPPGEYYLGAAIGASEGDWLDPAFLEALAAKSLKLSLAEGEHKTQELRIGG
jgi:hypothetical protein